MRVLRALFVAGAVVLTAVSTAGAAEEGHHEAGSTEARDGGHHDRNGLALFLGTTDEPGHGTEATWGIEYGHRIGSHWGIGGLVDYAGGEQRNLVVAPAVFWWPFESGLTFLAAPGVEWHNGRGGAVHHLVKAHDPDIDKDEAMFVLRLGAAYWFHVGARYGIAPSVNLDLVDGHEVWVYGLGFEVRF